MTDRRVRLGSQDSGREAVLCILLVEPDDSIAEDVLTAALRRRVEVHRCRDGAEALVALGAHPPDLLVIAASTPVLASARVIEIGRRHHDLCVVVGAGEGDARVAGDALSAGATAIVARPYDLDALLAIGQGLRSPRAPATSLEDRARDSHRLVYGQLTVNLRAHEARVRDVEILLTTRELDVLVYLLRRRGEVASREEISAAVWGHPVDTNTVAVHIKRLRDKLAEQAAGGHGPVIRTIRGVGYRLLPNVAADAYSHPAGAAV